MKRWSIGLTAVALLFMAGPNAGLAHREITNKSGKPVRVMELNNEEGKPFARLFMTGKNMSIDHYKFPESGAGYYEALEGHFYYIAFTEGGLGGLHVDKIVWDDTGKTIAIKGLRPFFDGADRIQIISDATNPRIEDGILTLQLKHKGGKEYKFNIRFGIGVSIEPSLYE